MMHQLASRHPGTASVYLQLFRLARYLPDDRWKQYVLNSLQSVNWPPTVALSPANVNLGDSISVRLVPHLREFDFAAHIYRRLRYEEEVISWLKQRTYDLVIEIGANVGFYTLLFSRLWPAASVYCFEPSRTAFARLLQNLSMNGCENVYPFNLAVASQTGFLEFYEPEGHLTNGSLDHSFAGIFSDSIKSTKVASVSGSQIAQLMPKGTRALLKIDVEGAEPIVLASLKHLIISERPDILIEVLRPTVDALNSIDWLRGYRYYQLDSSGPQERDSFTAGNNRDYALLPLASTARA